MSNFKLQYISTLEKKQNLRNLFFKTLGVSKKVSCYESSLVVRLASLETPLILFTSWIMTNFVTVEKNPVYISSMSHTKHSVKKKRFLSFSLLFLASTVVIYALWKYCRLSLDHNKRFVVGHVTTMSAIKAQSERRVCDSTKGRRKVWKSRGGAFESEGFASIPAFIWEGAIAPPVPTELLDSRPTSLLLQVRSLSWEHANSNKFGGLALLRFVLL